MGSNAYLRLNVVVCGVNQTNESIINRLFPHKMQGNKRKLISEKDNIFYTQEYFEEI